MIDALGRFFDTLRVADLVDVLLVAFLFFVLLRWMRQTMSQSANRGIGIVVAAFAGLYLPARYFEMYLIGRVTEVLFVFILVATIVVFQSDLRRMLDRAGSTLFTSRSSREAEAASTVDLLVEAVSKLADTYTGAIIAIRGEDPWDHHIRGGVELQGFMSPPLLYSIFDSRTAGHDGAVLLEGSRITSFAAHLPMPEEQPESSEYGGTRHAAGVGLSDVCDALVIVVSEERGTISVAQDGKMTEVETAPELKERLSRFWRLHYGDVSQQRTAWWSWSNLRTALLSLVASMLLWGIFAYSPETVYRSYIVPVEYQEVPPDWRLEDPATTARVTLSGPDHVFRSIDPSELVISFSLDQPRQGINQLRVDRETLDLPDQLELDSVDPRTVEVEAQRLVSAVLPVSVPSRGEVPNSLLVDTIRVEPDSVTILMPEGSPYDRVVTESVDLDTIRQTTTFERSIVRPTDIQFSEDQSREVEVEIVVRPAPQDGPSPPSR